MPTCVDNVCYLVCVCMCMLFTFCTYVSHAMLQSTASHFIVIRVLCGSFRSFIFASVVWWSEFLATDPEARVRFPTTPDFLRSSGCGTGSTQPRE
jgi:hypothetical protein